MKDDVEFTILIDTREQKPWNFGSDTPTQRIALPSGDYTILGMEQEIAIERKSLNDLVNTLIHSKKRFIKELTRLRSYRAKAVAIEASLEDVIFHNYKSEAHPNTVLGIINCFEHIYQVPFHFWGCRQAATVMAKKWLKWAYVTQSQNKEKAL